MAALNERRAANGWRPLNYGIGLHLGDVTYGNIGTENRLEFTVIGDAANVAARIEALSKELEQRILLSAEVVAHLDSGYRPLGEQRLRGVSESRAIYGLVD